MKINRFTYRLLSALVAFFVLTGASLPSGLHQKTMGMEMCETMESHTMMDDGCDIGIACACSIEQAPVKTQSKAGVALTIIKASFSEVFTYARNYQHISSPNPERLTSALAEASPPVFLKNSTFLN